MIHHRNAPNSRAKVAAATNETAVVKQSNSRITSTSTSTGTSTSASTSTTARRKIRGGGRTRNFNSNGSLRLCKSKKNLIVVAVASFLWLLIAMVAFEVNILNNHLKSNGNGNGDHTDTADTDTAFLTMYGKHRFQESFDALPRWLQDYFTWHRAQTSSLSSFSSSSAAANANTKYVVLLCLPKDTLCGGLSDRLRPLPFYLFVAKHTNRVLCIYWEKPFGLEEFLQPIGGTDDNDIDGMGGIDWRCPNQVRELYDVNFEYNKQPNVKVYAFGYCKKNTVPFAPCVENDINALVDEGDQFVTLDLATHSNDCINNANLLAQRHSYGGSTSSTSSVSSDGIRSTRSGNSNELMVMPDISKWQYPEMIKDIFRVMFEPIPPLARQINATMTKLGLVENEYVSTHVRARYPAGFIVKYMKGNRNQPFDKDGGLKFEGQIKDWLVSIVNNAIWCGHLLAPELKVFFISDHNEVTRYAITNDIPVGGGGGGGGKQKQKQEQKQEKGQKHEQSIRAIGIDRDKEPLHMDGNHNQNSHASDFYSVFEDLLIMGGSRCVAHGIGSFGSFGAGLSGNRCRAIHRKYTAQPVNCPNDQGMRRSISINADEMIFGEEPGGEGKIQFKQ